MDRMPPFYFLRHGETDWNVEQRLQGGRNVPLNATGRAQAASNGHVLKALIEADGHEPAALDWLSSPLSRASETMQIARRAMGLVPDDYATREALRELTFGSFEGLTLAELALVAPEDAAARDADKWGYEHPGGESYAALSRRIDAFLKTLSRPAVLVSHGGVLRVVRGLLEGFAREDVPLLDIPQDKVFRFDGRAGAFHG